MNDRDHLCYVQHFYYQFVLFVFVCSERGCLILLSPALLLLSFPCSLFPLIVHWANVVLIPFSSSSPSKMSLLMQHLLPRLWPHQSSRSLVSQYRDAKSTHLPPQILGKLGVLQPEVTVARPRRNRPKARDGPKPCFLHASEARAS